MALGKSSKTSSRVMKKAKMEFRNSIEFKNSIAFKRKKMGSVSNAITTIVAPAAMITKKPPIGAEKLLSPPSPSPREVVSVGYNEVTRKLKIKFKPKETQLVKISSWDFVESDEEAAQKERVERREKLRFENKIEKEREASRIALQNMKATADGFEDKFKAMKELTLLSRCSMSEFSKAFGIEMGNIRNRGAWNPLQPLGLRLKEEEYYVMDEDHQEQYAILNSDIEEGEITQ